MSSQNVTLSVPKELLKRIKLIAARKGTSISKLLVDALTDLDSADPAYEEARRRHLALLRRPFKLGTRGRATWARDELHER